MIMKLKACGVGADISSLIKNLIQKLEANYEKIKGFTTKDCTEPAAYRGPMQECLEPFKLIRKYIKAGQALVTQMEGPRKKRKAEDQGGEQQAKQTKV